MAETKIIEEEFDEWEAAMDASFHSALRVDEKEIENHFLLIQQGESLIADSAGTILNSETQYARQLISWRIVFCQTWDKKPTYVCYRQIIPGWPPK